MPQTEPKSNFDVDLDFGQIWERRVCNIFEGKGSLEIKADKAWHRTGNLAFEFKCNGKKSGIAASEATWWVSVLTNKDDSHNTDLILIWKTEQLRDLLRQLVKDGKAVLRVGGDGSRAEMVIASVDDLIPALVHEKDWSARKEAYRQGKMDGIREQQEFYRNIIKKDRGE